MGQDLKTSLGGGRIKKHKKIKGVFLFFFSTPPMISQALRRLGGSSGLSRFPESSRDPKEKERAMGQDLKTSLGGGRIKKNTKN